MPLTVSLSAATDENLKVLAAIEQGELDIMLGILSPLPQTVISVFNVWAFL